MIVAMWKRYLKRAWLKKELKIAVESYCYLWAIYDRDHYDYDPRTIEAMRRDLVDYREHIIKLKAKLLRTAPAWELL